jgi:hypothetical protein
MPAAAAPIADAADGRAPPPIEASLSNISGPERALTRYRLDALGARTRGTYNSTTTTHLVVGGPGSRSDKIAAAFQ